MGLTIDYDLTTDLTQANEIRCLVKSLRRSACDLPFEEVGPVLEFKGQDTQFERGKKDADAWFKIKSSTMVQAGSIVRPLQCLFSGWTNQSQTFSS